MNAFCSAFCQQWKVFAIMALTLQNKTSNLALECEVCNNEFTIKSGPFRDRAFRRFSQVTLMMTAVSTQPAFRRKTLHEELTDAIREQIVNGDLGPGTRVPEKHLCTFYGVSRTPLREALKVLATEGLLSLEPNRGAWVSRITVEQLDEVFPVMGALEALSGELACKQITDAEIGQIRVLHRQLLKHYEKRDLAEYFAVNQRIHEAILDAARNDTLAVQYRSLAARVRRARYVANMTQERWAQATNEHEQIISCIETRDGGRLSVVLKSHLENKLETVRQWLQENEHEPR